MNPNANDPQQQPYNGGNDPGFSSPNSAAAPSDPSVPPQQQPSVPDWFQPPQPAQQPPAAPSDAWSPQSQPGAAPVQQNPAPVMGDMSGGMPPQPGAPMSQPPVYGQPAFQPNAGMPMQPTPAGSKRKLVMIVILLVVVAGLGVGGYFGVKALQKNHTKTSTNAAAKKSEASTTAPDINTLASFSFVQPPADKLNGMTVSAGSTAGETAITGTGDPTVGSVCDIFYGIIGQTDLPGGDIGDVVSKATATLKDNGVTITGPNTVKALVLKNASTSATYSLPSVSFSYTKSGVGEVAEYSISELKDTSHAAVLQVCVGKDTVANLTTKLNTQLAPVAAAIGVKTP